MSTETDAQPATPADPAVTPTSQTSVQVPWRELPVVMLAAFAFYLLTTTHNFCEAHDSITYINEIDRGEWFNPHHLLFRWLAGKFVFVAHLVAPTLDSALIVQGMNSLFAAGCLAVFYSFQRGILRLGPLAASIITVLPAVSFGFWYYSTAIEVYIIPLFFLLLSLYLMCRPDLRTKQMGWVGLFHGLAVLFHMVHGLYGLTIIAAMIARRKQPGFQPWRGFFIYLVIAFFVSTIPYGLVIRQRHNLRLAEGKPSTMADVAHWWAGYAEEDQFWNGIGLRTAVRAGIGFSRSFIGGHFVFAAGPVGDLAERALGGRSLQDEQYLVRTMSAPTAMALLILAGLTGAAVLLATAWQLRRWRTIRREYTVALIVMLTWLASYMGFFFFWEPDNVEFWIPQSVLIWMLASLLWVAGRGAPSGHSGRTLGRPLMATFAVVATLLAVVNFGGSIRYLMSQDNDLYYQHTEGLAIVAAPGDLVILDDGWIYGGYVSRYTGAKVRALRNGDLFGTPEENAVVIAEDIRHTLDSGGRVIFHPAVLDPPYATPEQLQFARDFTAPYAKTWVPTSAGDLTVYRLSNTPSSSLQ